MTEASAKQWAEWARKQVNVAMVTVHEFPAYGHGLVIQSRRGREFIEVYRPLRLFRLVAALAPQRRRRHETA
mgnify:CR=1 FL=1